MNKKLTFVSIIGTPVMVSGFWSFQVEKITWYKTFVPIIVFAIALIIFFIVQFVFQVAFKLFEKMKGAK